MKDSERTQVHVLYYANTFFGNIEIDRIMKRQLPRRVRRHFVFAVREWEDKPWVVAYRETNHTDAVASAALIDKPRRYEGKLIACATLDPELLAYLTLLA